MNKPASLQGAKRHYEQVLQELADRIESTDKSEEMSLETYLEAHTASRLQPCTKWFISGISGSGKSTIASTLLDQGYVKLRNITTRAMRPDETDADYVFTDNQTFETWNGQHLVFHPHITNKVWHGILQKDVERLMGEEKLFCDKSIKSTLSITDEYPAIIEQANFVYLLPPSFYTLVERIVTREQNNTTNGMDIDEIAERFEEEIEDMALTIELPYTYIVNDDRKRIHELILRTS
jgi:guanylate kinase